MISRHALCRVQLLWTSNFLNCWAVTQWRRLSNWDSQQPLPLSKAKRVKSGNCAARSPARLTLSLNIGLSRAKVPLVFQERADPAHVRASCRNEAADLKKIGRPLR